MAVPPAYCDLCARIETEDGRSAMPPWWRRFLLPQRKTDERPATVVTFADYTGEAPSQPPKPGGRRPGQLQFCERHLGAAKALRSHPSDVALDHLLGSGGAPMK